MKIMCVFKSFLNVTICFLLLIYNDCNGDTFDEFSEYHNVEDRAVVDCQFEMGQSGTRTCNCGYSNRDMVLPTLSGSTLNVFVINCKTLYIESNQFQQLTQLQQVHFQNIENLILKEKSLSFPRSSVAIHFTNAIIEEIPTHVFHSNIREIVFDTCSIGIFRVYNMIGIQGNPMNFRVINSMISRVENQAFKKIIFENLEFGNSSFGSPLQSLSFYETEVTNNFRITNCDIPSVMSGAFSFQKVYNFDLTNNRFGEIQGEGFNMRIVNSIQIRNNQFKKIHVAALRNINLDRTYYSRHSEQPELSFRGNHIEMTNDPNIIDFSSNFSVRIRELTVQQHLDCDGARRLEEVALLGDNSDSIYFMRISNDENVSLASIINSSCDGTSYWIYIVIGVISFLVILIIIFTALCIMRRRRARKLDIIMPDGKTYRETQIVMQIENHGLLKTDL